MKGKRRRPTNPSFIMVDEESNSAHTQIDKQILFTVLQGFAIPRFGVLVAGWFVGAGMQNSQTTATSGTLHSVPASKVGSVS